MPEKSNESLENREATETLEAVHENPELLLLPTPEQAEALRPGEKDPAERLEEARDLVEEAEEDSGQENPLESLEDSQKAAKPAPAQYVSRELRQAALDRQLVSIRRGLGAPARAFSKAVHQPVVRAVSEPVSKTVSRPSGLLGGGLVAFIGSSGYLYLAKSNGMNYSYFMFLALFAAGFLIGLGLELLIRMAVRRRHARG